MNFLKQLLRIIIAAPAGYYTVKYFNIDSSFLAILFYFGIYIVVSLPLEMIWKRVKKEKNIKTKVH